MLPPDFAPSLNNEHGPVHLAPLPLKHRRTRATDLQKLQRRFGLHPGRQSVLQQGEQLALGLLKLLRAQFSSIDWHADGAGQQQSRECRYEQRNAGGFGNGDTDNEREVLVRTSSLYPFVGAGRHAEGAEGSGWRILSRSTRGRRNL